VYLRYTDIIEEEGEEWDIDFWSRRRVARNATWTWLMSDSSLDESQLKCKYYSLNAVLEQLGS
jgi:hypothetical protein